MSQAPYVLQDARFGYRMGDQKVVDSTVHDGLWCAFNDYHMGVTTENLCEKYYISREEQDGALSQQKVEAAIAAGKFKDEIIPVKIPKRKVDSIVFDADEYVKTGTTVENLFGLRPSFKKDGSVTAENAFGINDGAAALVVMSREKVGELGVKPLVIIRGNANAG